MNKRIEELVKECSVQEWTSVHGKSMRFEPGQVEKFAELIVRECAELIRQDSGPDDDYNASRNMTIDMMAELIEKHFGVK
jgi:hypothetical protein